MEWIKVTDKMPEEKEYFVSGNNYLDGKDRKWTESERVLCVDDYGTYLITATRNGEFISEKHRDCDGFTHFVVAWMPIPEFKFED